MTCKDCIYRAMCYKHEHYAYGDEYDEKPCEMFKNKADFVEVIRCRNCNHCEIVIDQFDNDWYFCKKTMNNAEVKPDDFCRYGERKSI